MNFFTSLMMASAMLWLEENCYVCHRLDIIKVVDWLNAGTRMVIIINPCKQTVTVYRSRSAIILLTEEDVLTGGEVVPGWEIAVREIFV
jgi:Uma2 family endonuclease